jgi:hypothetical protein
MGLAAHFRVVRQFAPDDAFAHGTRARYVAGCRCDGCRGATAAYQRARTVAANEAVRTLAPAPAAIIEKSWRFGKARRYRACPGVGERPCPSRRHVRKDSPGGRCRDCRLRLIANDLVSAAPARRHLLSLARAGIGRRSVQAACDVADSILGAIRSGARHQVRRQTLARILAVTPDARADHALVPAARTWRWIRRLLDEGYTRQDLARALGSKAERPALQLHRGHVLARTEARVGRLYRRLTT